MMSGFGTMPYGGAQGYIPAAAQMPQGGLRAPTLNFQQPQLIKGTTAEDIFKGAAGLADAWKKRGEKKAAQAAADERQDIQQDIEEAPQDAWYAGTETIPEAAKRGGFIHGFSDGGAPEDIDWNPVEPDRNRLAGFASFPSNAIEAFRENAQAQQAEGFLTDTGEKKFTGRADDAEKGPIKSTRQLTFGDTRETLPKLPPAGPAEGDPYSPTLAELAEQTTRRSGLPEPMYAGARGLLPPVVSKGSAAEPVTAQTPEQIKEKEQRRNWLGLDEETRKLLLRSGLATLAGGSPYTFQNIAGGLMKGFETQAEEQRLAQQRSVEQQRMAQQKTIEQNRLELQRTHEENLNKNRELQLNIQAGRAFPIGRYDDPLTGASRVIYGQQVWNERDKKYEVKPIEAMGTPSGAVSLPETPTAPVEPGVRNESYLNDLQKRLGAQGPTFAATVRRIVNFEQDPATLPPKTRAAILTAAQSYANYSPSEYKEVQTARLNWTKKELLNPIIAFSTAIDHLGYADKMVDALKNGDIVAANRVANAYQTATGSPVAPTFNAVKGLISNEVQKAAAGGLGGVAEREELAKALDAARSPEQLRSVISAYKRLMAGGLNSREQVFTATTRYPAEKFRQKLTEEARAEMEKIAGQRQTTETGPKKAETKKGRFVEDKQTGDRYELDASGKPIRHWDKSGKLIQDDSGQ
jgi:hypothetical protein